VNNKVLGIAVWGIGEHAQRNILPAINESKKIQLIGITTRNELVRKDVVSKWDCMSWDDPDDMLNDTNIDIVYIATPVAFHYEQCVKVLEAGKHLWCEKLLTSTLAQTESLIKLSEARQLALCEALMYQYHPQFESVKEILKSNEIGEIKSINARFGFPHLSTDNYRYDLESGGGALTDAGVYPLSAALCLTQEYPVNIVSNIEEYGNYGIDDFGIALLKFPSKLSIVAEWCFGCSYRNEIIIWGEEGLVIVERAFSKPATFESKIIIQKSNGKTIETKIQPSNHFVSMFDAFCNAISNEHERCRIRDISNAQARLINEIRK